MKLNGIPPPLRSLVPPVTPLAFPIMRLEQLVYVRCMYFYTVLLPTHCDKGLITLEKPALLRSRRRKNWAGRKCLILAQVAT